MKSEHSKKWFRLNFFQIFIATFAILLPSLASATEFSPWYPRQFEFRPCATYYYETFRNVASSHCDFPYHSNDHFLNLSIGVPYFNWYGEAEVLLADTRHRHFGYDNFRLTVRYQLMDDVADPSSFSLVAGATVITASRKAVHDIGSFHHGTFETEFHVSAGKEFSCGQFWYSRLWGMLGLGLADTGSPWIRFKLHWDRNFWDIHTAGVFVNTLWGLGGDVLKTSHHFHGYGPIHHQSADLGAFYGYHFECGGELKLKYSYRVYAENFPKNASIFAISFCYPFGI